MRNKIDGQPHPSSSILDLADHAIQLAKKSRKRPHAIPSDALTLRDLARSFDFEQKGTLFKQHFFDIKLWDDPMEQLAFALTHPTLASSRHRVEEAAEAVAATVNYFNQTEADRQKAIDVLASACASDAFAVARSRALAATKKRSTGTTMGDALASAQTRRSKQDSEQAVSTSRRDDENIIQALYSCLLSHLGPILLRPLGFPASHLGLRCFVAATRAAGNERAVASLGRVWHASNDLGPLFVHTGEPSAANSASRTLVVIFSSLGWNGVVRAEWRGIFRGISDDSLDIAHALDTLQSWFMTNPTTGSFDNGSWWDAKLEKLCAGYGRVLMLGESMGATAALRFARHATKAVVALVPQINLQDFDYSGRSDFTTKRKEQLRRSIFVACRETMARVTVHVGTDPADLLQLQYLPTDGAGNVRIIRHAFVGHALGSGLKESGLLQKIVLRDLLGHSYVLPPAFRHGDESGSYRALEGEESGNFRKSGTVGMNGDTVRADGHVDNCIKLRDGLFYNEKLEAFNCWQVDIDPKIIDKIAAIFYEGDPFASLSQTGEPYESIKTPNGFQFFAHRVVSWDADTAWVSCDDADTLRHFESLFKEMQLPERLANIVPHVAQLQLYSAFFVTRTHCNSHNWHYDYMASVGTRALTLITPLQDFEETQSFQLSYKSHPRDFYDNFDQSGFGASSGEETLGGEDSDVWGFQNSKVGQMNQRRYTYHKGQAIVFGSRFLHSTEPGRGKDGQMHSYLCFTFGTDDGSAWPEIAQTLDTQSRVLFHPSGKLELSKLGKAIEEALIENV